MGLPGIDLNSNDPANPPLLVLMSQGVQATTTEVNASANQSVLGAQSVGAIQDGVPDATVPNAGTAL